MIDSQFHGSNNLDECAETMFIKTRSEIQEAQAFASCACHTSTKVGTL